MAFNPGRTRFMFMSCIGLLCLAPMQVSADISKSEVIEKARSRQAKVKAFEVKLRIKEDQMAGAVSSMFAGIPGMGRRTIPEQRTTLESTNRLLVDGSHYRYEDNHPIWSSTTGTLHQRSQTQVANGKGAITYFPRGLEGRSGSSGVIHQHGWHDMAKSVVLLPLMLTFRGLDSTLAAHDLRQLKPVGVKLPIGEIPCVRFDLGSTANQFGMWIDDDGLVRRIQYTKQGALVTQCDIRYEHRKGFDSFPVSWVDVRYGQDGKIMIENKVEVLEAASLQSASQSEFDIRFPPACEVYDQKNGNEYIIQPNGSMRAKPRPQGDPRSHQGSGFFTSIWSILGVGLLAVCGLLLVWYFVRRRRHSG